MVRLLKASIFNDVLKNVVLFEFTCCLTQRQVARLGDCYPYHGKASTALSELMTVSRIVF